MKIKHMNDRPFKTWSKEENSTWALLSTRQLQNLEDKASQRFFSGFEKLGLVTDKIPDFRQVKKTLQELISWKLVSTDLEFADGQSWFESLAKKEFFVTEYIRPLSSLDYTPKPDMFHDLFGHLPYLIDEEIRNIINLFTELMLTENEENRKKLGHVWWYTIEFGLVKEKNQIKAFGAGLTSSFGEINQVFANLSKIKPFDPKVIGQTVESPTQFHNQYFLLDSFEQLKKFLQDFKRN